MLDDRVYGFLHGGTYEWGMEGESQEEKDGSEGMGWTGMESGWMHDQGSRGLPRLSDVREDVRTERMDDLAGGWKIG